MNSGSLLAPVRSRRQLSPNEKIAYYIRAAGDELDDLGGVGNALASGGYKLS